MDNWGLSDKADCFCHGTQGRAPFRVLPDPSLTTAGPGLLGPLNNHCQATDTAADAATDCHNAQGT